MNSSRFWVAEYGKIFKASSNRQLANGDLELSKSDFEAALTLLEESDKSDLESVFRFYRYHGNDCLRVQNYVGVIRTDGDCQIEIVPKISKSQVRPSQAQSLLIKMLTALRDSPFKQGTIANLDADRMPLLEMVFRYFLERVADIVRQGIARSYVDSKDNLAYLRGKLQFSDHLKQNLHHRTRFYCEFDEFEANRPINRLIKRALEIVLQESRDARNIQHCRELMYWFAPVPASSNVNRDFRSLLQDRLVQHYAPAMPICRLILKRLNPLTQSGENRTISMLFDMNAVFEDYVVHSLSIQFPDWQVSTHPKRFHLVSNFQNKPRFQLIPDAELRHRSSGRMVIVDCKWKLINPDISSQGISQSDLYQLFAYCKKCLPNQEYRSVILIYPKTEEFDEPMGPFYFDEHNRDQLLALPFDLEQDCLILPTDGLQNENLFRLAA